LILPIIGQKLLSSMFPGQATQEQQPTGDATPSMLQGQETPPQAVETPMLPGQETPMLPGQENDFDTFAETQEYVPDEEDGYTPSHAQSHL
jgi:hypothetical protein